MSLLPPLHPPAQADPLSALRESLRAGRDRIAHAHRQGAAGMRTAAALVELNDRLITELYSLRLAAESHAARAAIVADLAVVAVGGYGRGELAPFSDTDLLFLRSPRAGASVQAFVSGLVRDLWDIGLTLAQSVRTPAECAALAREDLTVRTNLTEVRPLCGHTPLVDDLRGRMTRLWAATPVRRFVSDILAERAREHRDYHAPTVLLLEPNIKKSPGGLRDIHLLRWVGAARYAAADPQALLKQGRLTQEDYDRLLSARELLHRIRNELHFHAAGAQDVLTLNEQIRLAEWLGFEDHGPLLGVERFMQYYYRETTALHDLVMRFVDQARGRSRLRSAVRRILGRRVEEYFVIGRESLTIRPGREEAVLGDAERILLMFEMARGFGVRIGHQTLERVRQAVPDCEITPQLRAEFLKSLRNPLGLGHLLRGLHRVGLLGRLIPAFEHARCLIQFNVYHKYTVDEHTLRAVEAVERRLEQHNPIGQACREIHRKDLLHLALLLHDLGKGLGEDHCAVGRDIAAQVARDFALSDHERAMLIFMVHQHLLMAETAFRRDVSDPQTVAQFARAVATPEALRMLFVLTAADTEAVAPDSLTAWKEYLLNELYVAAMEELTGARPVLDETARAAEIRERLISQLSAHYQPEWLRAQIDAFPLSYLLNTDPQRLASHLAVLYGFDPTSANAEAEYLPDMRLCAYTVFAHDDLTPGIFSKIAGVLASAGFQIVSARIVTRTDGIVLDTFWGVDLAHEGPPPQYRRDEIAQRIEKVLTGRMSMEAVLAARHDVGFTPPPRLPVVPPQVEIDNDSSDRFTIVEVFANDRLGLLYDITRTLFELGLSVHSAKISTRLDQVADAFYVTTGDHQKVPDGPQAEAVRVALLAVLNPAE